MTKNQFRGRVLAVDDSKVMRELLVAQLEAEGFSVLAVDSGYAALDAAQHEDFDAVILDVQMPGMDGMEVGRALRSDRTACSAIAMYTSMSEAEVKYGFSDYDAFLPKPCDTRQLGDRIDKLIRKPRP